MEKKFAGAERTMLAYRRIIDDTLVINKMTARLGGSV